MQLVIPTSVGLGLARGLFTILSLLGIVSSARSQDAALDVLVGAYPGFLASHDGKSLIWKDGTRMPVSPPVVQDEIKKAQSPAHPTVQI
jgi:hypothetical protein